MRQSLQKQIKTTKGKIINFNRNNVEDQGIRLICFENTKKIEMLKLMDSHIASPQVLYLSKYKWNNLTNLYLGANNIGAKGCKYLSRTFLPQIRNISLQSSHIDDAGMLHLSKTTWKSLSTILLDNNSISTDGILSLVRAKWSQLTILSIYSNIYRAYGLYHLLLLEANLQSLYSQLFSKWNQAKMYTHIKKFNRCFFHSISQFQFSDDDSQQEQWD